METVDDYIDEERFSSFLESMPQVCVEIVLAHKGGVLVAKRANRPVKDEWFWPGSRLYKGEQLETAARRVGREELGIEVTIDRLLSVQEHFWDESAPSEDVSRHTVNIVYRAEPTDPQFEITLDDQHTDYEFIDEPRSEHHDMVARYFEDYDLGG